MNYKQASCGRCGFYFRETHLYQHQDGKKYCTGCRVKIKREPIRKTISKIDRIIEALLKVPPPPKENKKKKSKSKSSLKAKKK